MADQHNLSSYPRVAFDTCVLGYAQYGAGGRTGVFRMVEGLARGLAESRECELHFCGGENLRMWVHARDYLRRNSTLSSVPVLSYGSPARVYRFLGNYFWELAEKREIAFTAKAARKALGQVLRKMDRHVSPLDAHQIADKNIYHSPFYPLPVSTLNQKGLRRFLTVCDLINIQHPEVSRDGGAFLKHILSSAGAQDWFIAISETTKRALCDYRNDIDPARVFVVPLAASELFRPATPEAIASVRTRLGLDKAYFLSVCTVDKRKNLSGLVKAFAEWLRVSRNEDTDLVLTGSLGESAAEVQALIREQKLDTRVRLTGYVPDADLAPLYSGAIAFVCPSLYEGFGLPILEAMQCGVPVVSSNDEALKEVGGDAALYFDPHSVDSMAEALERIYAEGLLREDLSQAGLLRATAFSWKKSTEQLLAAYRSALAT